MYEIIRYVLRNEAGYYLNKTSTLSKGIEDARTFIMDDAAKMFILRTAFKYEFSVIKVKITYEEL